MTQTVEIKAETAPEHERVQTFSSRVLDWYWKSAYKESQQIGAETAYERQNVRVFLSHVLNWLRKGEYEELELTSEYQVYRLRDVINESCGIITDVLWFGTLYKNMVTQSVSAMTDACVTTAQTPAVAEEPGAEQEQIERLVDAIFKAARQEDFEDGMESTFSRALVSTIRQYGNRAMPEISYLILYKGSNDAVSSEALRWIGRVKDAETYGWRLWLLEKSLFSVSVLVRDGAMLGIASVGDRHAMPYLKRAIEKEDCVELREDMKEILRELEAVPDAAPPEEDSKI
jgi:hypothetical protein